MEHFDWLSGFWFPYVNFFIFLAVLILVARRPLSELLQRRRKDYEALYQAACEAQKVAQERLDELNKRLSQLDQEIANMQQRGREQAQQEAERIIAQGEQMAKAIKEEARRIAAGELLEAQAALQDEMLEAVKARVITKLQDNLQGESQIQLFHRQLAELKQIASER